MKNILLKIILFIIFIIQITGCEEPPKENGTLVQKLNSLNSETIKGRESEFKPLLGYIPIERSARSSIKSFSEVYGNLRSMAAVQLPSSYNWKSQGKVTPAKDQGSCGSCWAFALTGAFESKILIKKNKTYDLSELQLLSCANGSRACNGGNELSIEYWYYNNPIEESFTGYNYNNLNCNTMQTHQKIPYKSTDMYGYYEIAQSNINNIKTSIYNDGPGFLTFTVRTDFFTFWASNSNGSVYRNRTGVVEGGHAVLLIGWDDAKQAWLCKNSWGATDGPNGDGTFWISYFDHTNSLQFSFANFKIIKTEKLDFNTDSRTDLGFWFGGDGNIWLGMSNGTNINWQLGGNAWPPIPFLTNTWRFTGDFNGDGRTDLGFWFGGDGNIWLGISNGSKINWQLGGNGWPTIPYDTKAWKFTGDFNGDGKTDIGFWSGNDGSIWLGISNGSKINWQLGGSGWPTIPYDTKAWKFTGDFNGDGKIDIGFWSGNDGSIWLGISSGSKINWQLAAANAWPALAFATNTWRFTGDFNGDGKTDLGFWHGGDGNIWLGISDGSTITWRLAGNAWPTLAYATNTWRFTGDFNGDGKTDLGFWHGDGNVWFGITKSYSTTTRINWECESSIPGWYWIPYDPNTMRFTGDFNGDNKTDIGFWFGGDGNIWLGLSSGATDWSFNSLSDASINWQLGTGTPWGWIVTNPSTWRIEPY